MNPPFKFPRVPAVYTFPAVGHCIYCPRTDGLSDEHIIPYGLNGRWILPQASCPSCRDKTSAIETAILRESLLPFRTAFRLGVP